MKKKFLGLVFGLMLLLLSAGNSKAQDQFIAEIRMFAGNFAPRGWAFCEGQLLPIAQNTALFSLVGTIYGGDGRTTFALPDLRGRVAVGVGNGPGLTNINQGQKIGTETVTISQANLPSLSNTVSGVSEVEIGIQKSNLSQHVLIQSGASGSKDVNTIKAIVPGGGQPINNIQPSIGIRYIIALQGIYPSRS